MTNAAPTPAPLPLSPGELVDGKYRVTGLLGRGAMGAVLAARQESTGKSVAIKCILPEAVERSDVRQRFEREARAVSGLSSEHVARLFDLGTLPSGSPYMVIEYLEGEDLGRVLQRERRLPLDRAVDHVLQALDALAEAHARGFVHRDIKPSNLFWHRRDDGSQEIKVLDFGVSKVRAFGEEQALTGTHTLIGSPYYMAPEQVLAAKRVDHRADLWATGVLLHELLTGEVPFPGDNIGHVITAILSAPVPSLCARVPGLPPAVDDVLRRCLERDVSRRYQHAGELAFDLARLTSSQRAALAARIDHNGRASLAHLVEEPPTSAVPSTLGPATVGAALPAQGAGERARGLVGAAVVLALLAAGVVGGYVYQKGHDAPRPGQQAR